MTRIDGEYWITGHNEIVYCDGDAGVDVPNHEAVVATHAWQLIKAGVEAHGSEASQTLVMGLAPDEEVPDLPGLRGAIHETTDMMHRDGNLPQEGYDDCYAWLAEEAQVTAEIIDCAFDAYREGVDSRSFAMKEWGWIRIAGDQVTLFTVNKETCKRLDDGLGEICEQEGLRDYTELAWSVESIQPAGFCNGLSGGLLSDHKTLREALRTQEIPQYGPGWTHK